MKYCVYTHSKNGKVLYVGCGNERRPQQKAPRNKLWIKLFKDCPPEIRVIGYYETYSEALAAERALIYETTPPINCYGRLLQKSRPWGVRYETWEKIVESFPLEDLQNQVRNNFSKHYWNSTKL